MKTLLACWLGLALCSITAASAITETEAGGSADYIDPKTGHRVIRLSPDEGGGSLYFHQNTYTPEGDKLIFNAKGSVMAVDLTTLGKEPLKRTVVCPGSAVSMAFKSREVYVNKSGGVVAVNVDTKAERPIKGASKGLINCDESFCASVVSAVDPTGKTPKPEPRKLLPQRERMFADKIKMGIPLSKQDEDAAKKEDGLAKNLVNPASKAFKFTNLKTGESKTVGYQYAWLNHMQFSPADPNYMLYCHEGTWHEVDRVWIIRTDGTDQRLLHKRSMDMEIAGHEFWSYDGNIVWYDNQTPRSKDFWVQGVNIHTGERFVYHLERDEWSIHFNVSRDGKLFAGDGANSGQVAYAKNGRFIYAFYPEVEYKASIEGKVVNIGKFRSEKLVDMTTHKYSLEPGGSEPNVTITPDGKWVVFRSNLQGKGHVYAAEVAKAKAVP
jgi:oligogalacturonide lyase